MSKAAAALLRALLARADVNHRVLLTSYRSTDWQSLTFVGERHQIGLRVPGADSDSIARRITEGVEDAEFAIRGQIVADVALARPLHHESDGSISLELEALTISE